VRIERLLQAYDVDLQWRYFPLHPETPPEGQRLEDLFAGRGYDLDRMYREMKSRMEEEGLEYGPRTHTYNSRLAQELARWADSGTGPDATLLRDAIHLALYRAYFVHARNIGEIDVLLEIAAGAGLPVEEAGRVLGERRFRAAVDEDHALARRYGITGVPTFVCGGRGAVGAQPYPALERLVIDAGARGRAG
jgi:predicted DsbA family dithiol-disulfide isomerase